MRVTNVHQRLLYASPERVGALIDSLSSPADAMRSRQWPRLVFDRPLGVGAAGGHGPIRYFVEGHVPGQSVRFRFTGPKGFDGWHGFEVLDATRTHCILEHRIEMNTSGPALLTWPLMYRHLHDALTDDVLTQAQLSLGNTPKVVPWSAWVRFLRWLVTSPLLSLYPARRRQHAG